MKCKGLQIIGSWSQNINMPEKASNVASRGLLLCYGIIILIVLKIASRVKSDGLKVIVVHSVVVWEIVKAGRVALAVGCGLVKGCG